MTVLGWCGISTTKWDLVTLISASIRFANSWAVLILCFLDRRTVLGPKLSVEISFADSVLVRSMTCSQCGLCSDRLEASKFCTRLVRVFKFRLFSMFCSSRAVGGDAWLFRLLPWGRGLGFGEFRLAFGGESRVRVLIEWSDVVVFVDNMME